MGARIRAALAAAAVGLAGCRSGSISPPTPAPPVRVATTASAAPFVRAATDRSTAAPVTFVITVSPSNPDLLEAAAGESLIGVTLFLPEGASLWATALDTEPIAVIVNPASAAEALTLAQVEDIYTGRNSQWAAAAREDGDDSRQYFESVALHGLRPAATINIAPSPAAMLKFVGRTPDGIGYLPLRWVDETVRPLAIDGKRPDEDGYPLIAVVVAVARKEPTGPAREWLVRIQSGVEK